MAAPLEKSCLVYARCLGVPMATARPTAQMTRESGASDADWDIVEQKQAWRAPLLFVDGPIFIILLRSLAMLQSLAEQGILNAGFYPARLGSSPLTLAVPDRIIIEGTRIPTKDC